VCLCGWYVGSSGEDGKATAEGARAVMCVGVAGFGSAKNPRIHCV
jgi:hypothetical protein